MIRERERRAIGGFFITVRRSSAEAAKLKKCFRKPLKLAKQPSRFPWRFDTLHSSEWRTSNLLHSHCPVKHAFAEVVSGAWLPASCQHRGAGEHGIVHTLRIKSSTRRPFVLRKCHESFAFLKERLHRPALFSC